MGLTHIINDFLLHNTKELLQLTAYFISFGFAAVTLLSLFGYGIFKALSLVNITNK